MNLVWLTDIHLNFLDDDQRNEFYQTIANTKCDGVIISGDIAEATCIESIMNEFAAAIKKPIYFVLGNHDYYEGQVDELRKRMKALSRENEYLFYLPKSGIKQLSDDVILLGEDGWADGRYGDYDHSEFRLNDSVYIQDLAEAYDQGKAELLEKMQALADADAASLKEKLLAAIAKKPKKIIIATHVPPFKEACTYKGEQTDDDHLPYFSSKAMGDVIKLFAKNNPDIEFSVLSGHTHHPAECSPLHNLHVSVGKAEYTNPASQKVIEIGQHKHAMMLK